MAKAVGDELMTRYVVGFEVAGLLLTAALVGAIALAHREEEEPDDVARGDRTSRDASPVNRPRSGRPGLGHLRGTSTRLSRPVSPRALDRCRVPDPESESSLHHGRSDIPLNWFLYFAAASFAIGLVGVLLRRNAIAVLMAIEIMLNAANVNLVAFWRYGTHRPGPGPLAGVILAIFVITVAAAEVAVGIGLILLCYRRWHAADVDRYDSMSG